MPSRMPRPDSEIGTTCAIATAGTNATTAANGTPAPSASARKPTVAITEIWYRSAVPSTPSDAGAGRDRSRPMPTWIAPMKRIQFVVLLEPARGFGVTGEEQDRSRVPRARCPETSRAIQAVDVDPGVRVDHEADEAEEREGEEPGEAFERDGRERGLGRADVLRAAADPRTSPPMVDGSTLPTNWPAK